MDMFQVFAAKTDFIVGKVGVSSILKSGFPQNDCPLSKGRWRNLAYTPASLDPASSLIRVVPGDTVERFLRTQGLQPPCLELLVFRQVAPDRNLT